MAEDVARLEEAECAAWDSMFAAAPAPLAQGLGLSCHRFGDAFATVAKAIDIGQFNRVQALGLGGGDDEDAVDEATAMFRRLGLKNYLVQIPPGPAADALTRRARGLGLVPFRRSWTKFRRDARPIAPPPTELVIREAGPEQARDFGETAAAGFGMPPPLAGWLAGLVGRPGWRCYVSYDGDAPIGVGAAFISGDTAWLGIGATRPQGRGRGGQSAILARRVTDAAAAGASLLVTETGSAVEGEPQTSFGNILKAGFEIAYERPNWTEAPASS